MIVRRASKVPLTPNVGQLKKLVNVIPCRSVTVLVGSVAAAEGARPSATRTPRRSASLRILPSFPERAAPRNARSGPEKLGLVRREGRARAGRSARGEE